LRRSPLVMLMCVEIMLNAANLAFIAFARYWGDMTGQIFTFLVVTVAAAEVAIGLAIIVLLFRHKDAADVDDINALRGSLWIDLAKGVEALGDDGTSMDHPFSSFGCSRSGPWAQPPLAPGYRPHRLQHGGRSFLGGPLLVRPV